MELVLVLVGIGLACGEVQEAIEKIEEIDKLIAVHAKRLEELSKLRNQAFVTEDADLNKGLAVYNQDRNVLNPLNLIMRKHTIEVIVALNR